MEKIRLLPEQYTYFEQVAMITKRAEEIELKNASPLIEVGDITNASEIALLEFKKGVIPYTLVREFPDGTSKYYVMVNSKQ